MALPKPNKLLPVIFFKKKASPCVEAQGDAFFSALAYPSSWRSGSSAEGNQCSDEEQYRERTFKMDIDAYGPFKHRMNTSHGLLIWTQI